MKTSYGSHDDLIEDINGGNASLIVLSNVDPMKLSELYNKIKVGKQVVNGYYADGKHCLLCFVDGKIKFKN